LPLNGSSPIDTLWIAIATGLVLLMTPALALFYGGLVRSKSILNTMMMSLASFGVVGVTWIAVGYSLAFGSGNAWLGNLDHALLRGVTLDAKGSIPHLLFMAYQGTFAVITAGLISGALVERMRFSAYLLFITLWSLAVYSPIAHWVWGGGWLGAWGVLDFAGGTVVHIAAGTAAGIGAVVVGSRRDYGRQAFLPHNVPMMLTGTALLWFGWLGFNGGSALTVNGTMVVALVNTILAPMTSLAVWLSLDLWRTRHATAVGAGTGIVVGLVAVTPAAGFVSPLGALAIGALSAVPSYFVIARRAATRLDDSLDVVGAHGVGGIVGALLTGVFATRAWGSPDDGLLAGNAFLVVKQAAGVGATILYAGLATLLVLKLVAAIRPLRVPVKEEAGGLDVSQHGEEGYSDGEGAMLVLQDSAA
jgi:ammonium transporter, Amt family